MNQWQKIIWSDECSVERGSGKNRKWVFRFPDEKWQKNMVEPYRKGHGVSVMVWGAFYGTEASNLVVMKRDSGAQSNGYTASSYIDTLEAELPSLYEPGLVFMQDNAPIHKARRVLDWFIEQGIEVLDWPPYSPDLNPIEHLWPRLKNLVYQIDSHIEEVGGNVEKVQKVLGKALERAWKEIDPAIMEELVNSMPRLVAAVTAADGWYTKY